MKVYQFIKQPVLGMVTSVESKVSVVFKRTPDGDWAPLYAIKGEDEQVALPPCFTPMQEDLDALTFLFDEQEGFRDETD